MEEKQITHTEIGVLENKRKHLVKRLNILWCSGILLFIVLALLVGNSSNDIRTYGLIVVAIAAGFYYYLFLRKPMAVAGELKNQLRSYILNKIIKEVDAGIEYDPTRSITKDSFIASDLFGKIPNSYGGSNYFSVAQHDFEVEFSEVSAYVVDQNGENNKRLFEGLFFIFTIHKFSNDRTLVTPDSSLGAFEFITNALDKRKYAGYDRIKSENKDFEEQFNVFTNEPVHAARLVNEEFQEILIRLKKTYDGDIFASLGAEKSYLLINSERSFFHISIESESSSDATNKAFINDLTECLGIIQTMSTFIKKI